MHASSKVPTRHSSTRRSPAVSNKANDNNNITWVGPDNITAFVRCLRLLDLNKKDDWPTIATATFAARSNLQTRIRCTEWSLYCLFEIWDPSYTKDKLRPFFPPQAPLQSLNLRAALFRGLTDLKKHGVLGREITLRKTMLDDCKGGKFEEVLYAFAMLVLRKQAKTRRDSSLNLALADSLNKRQQDALLPLVIAHRQAVSRQVDRRNAVQQQIAKYEWYLEDQRQALNDRKKLLEWSLQVPVIADADLAKEILLDNWSGDEKGAQFMLGRATPPSNSVQYESFEHSWNIVQNGDSETPQRSYSLLDDLNARVSEQQARLGKWKEFYASMQQHEPPNQKAASRKKQSSPPKVNIDKHQDLYVDKNGVQYSAACAPPPLSDKHAALLESLRAELFGSKISSEATYRNRQGTLDEDPNLFSGVSARQQRSENPGYPFGQKVDDQEKLPKTVEKEVVAHDETAEPPEGRSGSCSPSITALNDVKASIDPTPPSTPLFVKPERRNKPERKLDQESAPPTLQERTRQSMALFSSASSPPQRRTNRTSNQHPRSSQVFPVNQFETPRKANTSAKRISDVSMAKGSPGGDSGASTPKEKLFSQDAEYGSVFKSRPRIALSPRMSPERSALELEAVLREDMERLELSDEQ